MKLFEAASDAVNGFDVELASSGWGIEQADFVIADFRMTPVRQFDVGFVSPVVAPGGSLVQFRRSRSLGVGPGAASAVVLAGKRGAFSPSPAATNGVHGPFTIGSGQLFDLYEIDLPAGAYSVRLVPGAGSVDWGMALYGPGPSFVSRSDALPGGTAWEAPAGTQESMNVVIAQAGYHSLVVWKNRRAEVNTSGTFTLEFIQQTTGTPDETVGPRVGTLIAAVRPSPFVGSTQVEVDLTQASNVSLHVFDLAGRCLYSEEFGLRSAGRQALEWDGRDEAGRPVPVGIYFVRVTAGSESDGRKVVRVR